MQRVFYILILLSLPILSFSQTNDCVGAVNVCGNGPISFNPIGAGNPDFSPNVSGCLANGETNSAWYFIGIETTAPPNQPLGFTINPNTPTDYDFAIYGPDLPCTALGNPIRCSYAGTSLPTGLGNGATDLTEGAGGDGFVADLIVQPGQGYYILINNFSGNNSGFDLTWTGSGANYLNCTATPPCGLVADAGTDIIECSGAASFSLNGTTAGGGTSTTYLWSGTAGSTAYLSNPAIANPTVTIPPGISGSFTFTMTATDGGCIDVDDVLVTINQIPTVTLSTLTPLCTDDTPTSLIGTPAGGIWSPNAPGGLIDPAALGAGTYTVTYTYTDANNCTDDATSIVTINFPPVVSIIPVPILCASDPTPIPLVGTPPGGTWSPNVINGMVFAPVLGVGQTTVTYTYTDANGCTSDDQTDITVLPDPAVAIIDPGPICAFSAPIVLNAAPPGGVWGPTAPNSLFDPSTLAPGIYPVDYTYSDPFGCTATATFDINVISAQPASIEGDLTHCLSDGLQALVGTPAGGSWSTNIPNGIINPVTLGVGQHLISYIVTDVSGCTVITTENIEIYDSPSVNIDPINNLCSTSGPQTLSASPPGGTWGPNSPGGIFNPVGLASGSYIVTYQFTDPVSNCSDIASLSIQVGESPTVSLFGSTSYCPGSSTTIDAGTGYSNYLWSNSGNTNSITVNTPGTYTVTVTNADGCTGTAEQLITESNAITTSISGVLSICSGASTTLEADPGFTNYIWSNSTSSQSITVNLGGTYTVTVTDASGCTGTEEVVVSLNNGPTPTITGATSFCPNNSTTITTDTYTSYLWSNSMTSQSIPVSITGTYTVTVTDANGCTGTEETFVNENNITAPSIAGNLNYCQGSSTILDAGGGYVDYMWSNGGTTQTNTISQNGNIGVTVTDTNGCTSETSVSIVENPLPSPSIAGSTSFCIGSSTILDAGSWTGYLWSDNSTGQTLTASTAGTYTVTVTDASGCTGTSDVAVTVNAQLQPNVVGNLQFCEGASTTLDAGSGFTNYAWSNSTNMQTISPSTGGTYTVTVTDASGCTGTAEVNVTSSPNPIPTLTGATSFCAGNNTIIDAGTWTSYLWSDNTTAQTLTANIPGTYTVTVTNAASCTGTEEVVITENSIPPPVVTGNLNYCQGTSTVIDAGAGYINYIWSNGGTTQTNTISQNGNITVTVTDATGCTNETTVNVIEEQLPVPTISGAASFCTGTSTTLDAGTWTSYIWSDNSTNNELIVNQAGTYTVTVTNVAGCTGTEEIMVTVNSQLQPSITGETEICDGNSTLLNAGTWTSYIWSDNSTNQALNVTQSGTYTVTVSDALGCTGTSQTNVVVEQNPEPQISGSSSFCVGTTTTLDAGSWNTYLWSDNTIDPTLIVGIAGTYTVTVSNVAGCTGNTEVTVTESTSLNPAISGNLGFCTNNNTLLDAGQGFATYLWSDNSTDQTLNVTQSGTYTVTVSDASGCTGETSVSVIENTPPTPSITGQTSFCTGTSTTVDAGANYTDYLWSDGSLSQSLEVFISGTYTVTVTDANGCTGETFIDISELSSLDPAVTGAADICPNETITLSAITGFVGYVWQDGSTNETFDVSTGGTYTVTVTDANGCTGEETISISQNNSPVPSITGGTEICVGSMTSLNADPGYVSYLWSDMTTNEFIDVNQAGTYTVTVTDQNGCTGTIEETVTELTSPNTTITGTDNFCPNGSTIIEADAGFVSYLWDDGTTNQSLEVFAAGTYTVTITDINGCTNEEEISITENIPPAPSIVGASSFCSGNSTTISTSQMYSTYLWSDNSSNQSLEVSISGTYTVTVTDVSGCTGTEELLVTETTTLLPAITGEMDFCENGSTLIEAEIGYLSYLWSDNSTDPNITITVPGTYTVTVTDAAGCTGTNEVSIIENIPPVPSIAGSTSFCTGFSTTLDVGSNYVQYLWSDNTTASTLEVFTDGIFTVTVTDANGCTGTASTQVMESTQLNPVISGANSFCTGTSSLLDAGSGFTNYLWSDNSNGQTLDVTTPGVYTVTVTDASGCTGETSLMISENTPSSAGLANAASNLCSVDVTTFTLMDELTGADLNGVWSETSNNASTGIAFNAATGTFNTNNQLPGTYTFEYFVAGVGACPDDSETVTIIIDESPQANIAVAQDLTCIQEMISLDGQASMSSGVLLYNWTTTGGNIVSGSTTSTPTVDQEGTYILTVTSSTGCTSTAEIFISENVTFPDANAGLPQEITCGSSTVTLSGSSTFSNVLYQWTGNGINSTNMNLPNPIVDQEGTYTLITIDPTNGCESMPSDVLVTTSMDIPTVTIDPVGNLTCNITSQILVGPTSPIFTYQWQLNGSDIAGATDDTYEVSSPGIYTLNIIDTSNGCGASQSIEVMESTDVPDVEAGQTQLLTCTAGFVTLNGTGSSVGSNIVYTWLDPNGNPIPNSNSITIDVTQAGQYSLIVLDMDNGCDAIDVVMINADTNFPTSDAGGSAMLDCDFNSIQIGGNSSTGPEFIYSWTSSTGGNISNTTIPNPEINEPGEYELTVTNTTNGCSSTSFIVVSENTNVPTNAEIILTPIKCHGDNDASINIVGVDGGTEPYLFSLDGSSFSNTNFFPQLGQGNYDIQILDAGGCEWDTQISITEPDEFILNLGMDTIIELSESVNLLAQANMTIDSIAWRQDLTLSCDGCVDPIVTPLSTTTYQATAYNGNDCESSDFITVYVEKNRDVYLPNVFTPNEDGNNDIFYIQSGDNVEKIRTFQIFTRWGELVFQANNFIPNDISKGWDGTFAKQKLNPAVFVYFAEVEYTDGEVRVIKGDVAIRK